MATTTLTGTTGNNLLNAPGSVSTLVQGLQGNDTINLALINDEAQGGQGNDIISNPATGVVVSAINGGDGNDTVSLTAAGQFGGYVSLGSGADSIAIVAAALVNGGQIYGNEGNDTVSLNNSFVNATVGGGEGADLIAITGAAPASIQSSLIHGGMSKDTITIGGHSGTFATIQGGKGADVIGLTGAAAFASSLVGAGQYNDVIRLGAGAVASVAGGGNNDTITLLTGFGGGAIYGDAVGVTTVGTGTEGAADGTDSITVSNVATGATQIYGGGGADTIRFLSGIGAFTAAVINGGNGADSIFVNGSGASYGLGTITGGAGNDTITLGTGTTSVANVRTALGTITGGDGTDLIGIQQITAAGVTTAASLTSTSYAALISGASGDTVRTLTAFSFTAGGGGPVTANWVGNAPTVYIGSSTEILVTAVGQLTAGSVGVFSNDTDSVIAISNGLATTVVSLLYLRGVDLTTATSFGTTTMTATTVKFNVTLVSGGGMNINFA